MTQREAIPGLVQGARTVCLWLREAGGGVEVAGLQAALLGIVAAEARLTGAEARRRITLEAGDWRNDATLALETDLEAPASATK